VVSNLTEVVHSFTQLLHNIARMVERCEVCMAVKNQVKVFWVVTLHSVAVGDQHFIGPCCPSSCPKVKNEWGYTSTPPIHPHRIHCHGVWIN